MVSSGGEPATEGAGDSVCASRHDDAATRQRKTAAERKFTSATVLATPESTSGNLMAFEKPMNFLRQFRPDPFRGGDLFHRRFPQPVHRTKFPQQQVLPVLAHARAIVEDTFADPLLHQELLIGVRQPVRLIADSLE